MICILGFDKEKNLDSWVLVQNLEELKRVSFAFSGDLHVYVTQLKEEPQQGKTVFHSGHIMLVV